MDIRVKNKKSLITGASRGLGFAIARLLAQEGAEVALNSRSLDNLQEAARNIAAQSGQNPLLLPGDITDPTIPQRMIEQISQTWGELDLLVCNAGGPPSGSFENFDDAAWQKAVELSFFSQVRTIRAALPLLRKSHSASVLTITSYSVKQPIPNLVLSNSIRAATVGLTKTLALELGSSGIRFNSILPAWTDTERVQELMAYRAQKNGTTIEQELARQAQDSPFARLGTPEEFANAAVFLLSPAASYITGTMLTVDGGMYKGTL